MLYCGYLAELLSTENVGLHSGILEKKMETGDCLLWLSG